MYEDDRKMAQLLLRGNKQAFDEFFRLYYSRIYRFCARRVDENDAEDIAVETLRHAIRRIETYRGEASLLSWLYKVARSQLSAHYKRSSKHQNLVLIEDSTEVQAEVEAMTIDLAATPEALRDREQHQHLVHYMLDSLPGDYGRILEWKYVEGFSVEEIAARLEASPTAIQSMLARARKAFRTAYSEISDQLTEPTPLTQPGPSQ